VFASAGNDEIDIERLTIIIPGRGRHRRTRPMVSRHRPVFKRAVQQPDGYSWGSKLMVDADIWALWTKQSYLGHSRRRIRHQHFSGTSCSSLMPQGLRDDLRIYPMHQR